MRKVMLLTAMLAMVLAAAAPAFAQATAVQYDGDDTAFCNQVQNVSGITQAQYGDANAAATDESVAIAEAANELGVSQQQVLNCFVGDNFGTNVQGGANNLGGGTTVGVADVDDDADGVVDEDDGTETEAAVENGSVSASAVAEEDASASASATAAAADDVAELPETGGASLLALGAGALLVAGGLVARRIVR